MTAYVPDNPDIYDEFLTGAFQYLNYLSDIFEVPADVRERRIRAYADRLSTHLGAGRPHLPRTHLHGVRQKLVLIRRSCTNRHCWCWTSRSSVSTRGVLPREGDAARAGRWRARPCSSANACWKWWRSCATKVAYHQTGALRSYGPTADVVGDESLGRVPRHDRPERVGVFQGTVHSAAEDTAAGAVRHQQGAHADPRRPKRTLALAALVVATVVLFLQHYSAGGRRARQIKTWPEAVPLVAVLVGRDRRRGAAFPPKLNGVLFGFKGLRPGDVASRCPRRRWLLSRIASLYAMSLLFGVLVMVPAFAVYASAAGVSRGQGSRAWRCPSC